MMPSPVRVLSIQFNESFSQIRISDDGRDMRRGAFGPFYISRMVHWGRARISITNRTSTYSTSNSRLFIRESVHRRIWIANEQASEHPSYSSSSLSRVQLWGRDDFHILHRFQKGLVYEYCRARTRMAGASTDRQGRQYLALKNSSP